MTAALAELYPPAAEVAAAGAPYPFPTLQGVAPERAAAYLGPNADPAARAANGYAHPFVWAELAAAWERADRFALLPAWWRAVDLVEESGRYYPEAMDVPMAPLAPMPYTLPRRWSGPRAFAAVAFLVADLLDPADYDALTGPWSATFTLPTLTRKAAR